MDMLFKKTSSRLSVLIPSGSTSCRVPQDAQDEIFMTTQEDCSLSACVAFTVAVSSSPLYFVCMEAVYCMRRSLCLSLLCVCHWPI